MKKIKYADEGDKVNVKKCPNCDEEVIINMKDGSSEVFECENCKFEVKKK